MRKRFAAGPLNDAGRWIASGGAPSAVLEHCERETCPMEKEASP
jgi:hypothetical protein